MNTAQRNGFHAHTAEPARTVESAGPESDPRLLQLLIRSKALELLLELPEYVANVVQAQERRGNVCVAVVAWRADRRLPPAVADWLAGRASSTPSVVRSQCERDIMATLADLGASEERRFTTARILDRLQERGDIHGQSTIDRALARLVAVGLLVNAHDRRGYGLPTGEGS